MSSENKKIVEWLDAACNRRYRVVTRVWTNGDGTVGQVDAEWKTGNDAVGVPRWQDVDRNDYAAVVARAALIAATIPSS